MQLSLFLCFSDDSDDYDEEDDEGDVAVGSRHRDNATSLRCDHYRSKLTLTFQ